MLSHIYVLIPVLYKRKHYFVDPHEFEKLIEKGESWLLEYPEKELVANRYLRFKRSWAREVLKRLAIEDVIEEEAAESSVVQVADRELTEGPKDAAEECLERTIRMHDFRLDTVVENL